MRTQPTTTRSVALAALLVLACVARAGTVLAATTPPVVLSPALGAYPLGRHLAVTEDPSGKRTLDDARALDSAGGFAPSDRAIPSFGYTDSAYWARFSLRNPSPAPAELWLETKPAWLQSVDLYVVHADGSVDEQHGGLVQPSARQPLSHRHAIFPVTIAAGAEDTAYVRVRARNMQLDFTAWRPLAFLRDERRTQLAYGLFFGGLAAVALHNLLLFFAARLRSHLYVALYVLATILQQLTYRGFTTEWFPSSAATWILYSNVFPGAAFLFALEFGKVFLELRERAPLAHRAMTALQGAAVCVVALPFFDLGSFGSAFTAVVGGLVAMASLVAGAVVYRRGYVPARYYLLGWATLQVGGLVHIFSQFALLSLEPFAVRHSVQIGATLDAMLLSLALADRINVLRSQRERAQAEALRAERSLAESLDARVSERTDALDRALRATRDFYQLIAHELRTPLTAMSAHVRFLTRGMRAEPPTEQQRSHLDVIERNVRRMVHLSEQLLDLAKAEAETGAQAAGPVALHPLAEECVSRLAALFAGGVLCSVEIDPDLAVAANPGHVETILLNLLGNAAKFTARGEVVVAARREGREVALAVRDTGSGSPAGSLPLPVRAFERSATHASRPGEGAGLGLYICQQLVAKMGGRMHLESSEGVGTTATVWLRATSWDAPPSSRPR